MNIKETQTPVYLMSDYVKFKEWDAYFLKLGAPKIVRFKIIDLPDAVNPFVYKVTVVAKLDDGKGLIRSWLGIKSGEQLLNKLTRWVSAVRKGLIPRQTEVILPKALNPTNGSTPAI
jgi:hypothetical protein